MLACGLLNASIERIAYKPLRNAPRLAPLITAIGVSFIIEDVGLAWKGPNYITAPDVFPHSQVFSFYGVAFEWNKLIVVIVTVPVLLALTYLVQRTKQGKAMRATAQDKDAAAIMGINVNRTISFTFLIAGALAGAAGFLYSLYVTTVRFDQGFQLGLIAFTAAVLGGIGNLPGAVLGAILIGLHPGLQRGAQLARAGLRLDRGDRVLDPDPDPRLPARGPPRRTHAGGRMTERRAPTDSAPEVVGFRNQQRARWDALPVRQRAAISIALELLLAVLLFFVDHSLGYAVVVISALYWIHRLPPIPWKLAGQAVIVLVFLITGPRSLAATLAIAFGIFWIPQRYRRWALPTIALVADDPLSVLPGEDVHDPGVRRLAGRRDGRLHDRVRDDGGRPEHRGRLRRPARPRVRRVLRHRRVHRGLVRVGAVRTHTWHFGAVGIDPKLPGIHITIWLLLPLAGAITALFGILIGLPTLRLRGDYLAIVTLGFGEIIYDVARNSDNFLGTGFNLTNGPNGITPLDSIGFGHHAVAAGPAASCRRTTSSAATRAISATRSSRPTSSSGRRSYCSSSPSSARCACSTRGSAAPGSRSARTRPPRRRWGSR